MIDPPFKKEVRSVDLAIGACRKRQSPRTGFVHLFPTDQSATDTIPIYENFCFAYALFRQKTTESVLEGRALIERLLPFQSPEGNFPIYLHDFPHCWDFHLNLKIAPILIHLLRGFSSVLNADFKAKMEQALKQALLFAEKRSETHPVWRDRFAACLGKAPATAPGPSAADWFEWLISSQLFQPQPSYPIPYHPPFQLFLGPHPFQEKGEPQPAAIEYLLAEQGGLGPRLLADHPEQIYAALLFPFTSSSVSKEELAEVPQAQGGATLFWQGATLHSLAIPAGTRVENGWIFDLPGHPEPSREDLFEVSLFTDASSETSIFIEGKRGVVFSLGERLSLRTPGREVSLTFTLIEGDGVFLGHLSKGNRPGQVACRGGQLFEAYDWRIALRTLRRSGPCRIQLSY